MFPGEEHDEAAGQQQAEEESYRYDGHAWNV
jgi:hypothetical protein